MDFLKMILSSAPGSFGFVFGLMALAFWLTHWLTKKVTEVQKDHGTLNKSVTKIELHIDEIRKDLSYMKGSIDVIKNGPVSLIQSHSPISLSETGQKIAIELKAEEKIAQNWERIYDDLEKNICDKNAYDIQTYCMETAAVEPEKFFDSKTVSEIKMYAFNKGNSLSYYSGVFGVIIRDKYLQIKKIDVSEVDINDPNKK